MILVRLAVKTKTPAGRGWIFLLISKINAYAISPMIQKGAFFREHDGLQEHDDHWRLTYAHESRACFFFFLPMADTFLP